MNKAERHDAALWEPTPNNLEPFWMAFTPNRSFKKRPRLIARAKDMHYYDMAGRPVLDATAGLWCSNAGHCRHRSSRRSRSRQPSSISLRPSNSVTRRCSSLPRAFAIWRPAISTMPSSAIRDPKPPTRRSRWRSPITAPSGEARATRLIGRERGYHGVGFGGISVGGMVANRKMFGAMIAGVDHLPHTYNRDEQAYQQGRA